MARKSWKERWARLKAMSADELRDRVRQHACARADALRYRLGLGFPVELRADDARPRFFFRPEDVPGICELLRQKLPQPVEETIRRAERICQHRFDLLGYEELDYGANIDWHLDRVHGKRAPRKPFHQIHYLDFEETGDAKVTWELNRHQHLVTLAKAYRLSGNEKYASELFRQWKHWHEENLYPIGINWASSLEVALRSLSWLWMYFLLGDCPVAPLDFHSQWLKALGINGRHIERYLSTYFSPNTHLLGEGVALFFIGTLCPELKSADLWRERGWQIVMQEAERQVQADGFHFEQSTYYHVYALDFFLHARILASLNGVVIPAEFDRTLVKMLDALCTLGRAGEPPRFGDDDGGRLFDPQRNRAEHMLDPLATGAALFGRGDFKLLASDMREETLWLLGVGGAAKFDALPVAELSPASASLESAGLYCMAHPTKEQLVIDAGPQGTATAGHGHADALSVCVNRDGGALLIDPGTFEYVGDGSERNQLRGTSAHNTLQVDGLDQADPKGPFAWGKLPHSKVERWIAGENFDYFAGSHDGYCRLQSPVIHRRFVFSLKSSFWLVRDVAEGAGQHQLDLSWHLAPQLRRTGQALEFLDQQDGLALAVMEEHGWKQEVLTGVWSPAYGRKESAPVVHFRTTTTLPSDFVTMLLPVRGAAGHKGVLKKIEASGENDWVRGYRYETADEEHCFVFASAGRSWSLGPWTSDAEFVYLNLKPEGRRELIFCQGSYVEIGGQRMVSCSRTTAWCEMIEKNGRTELHSSDKSLVTEYLSLDNIAREPEPALSGNGAATKRMDN